MSNKIDTFKRITGNNNKNYFQYDIQVIQISIYLSTNIQHNSKRYHELKTSMKNKTMLGEQS